MPEKGRVGLSVLFSQPAAERQAVGQPYQSCGRPMLESLGNCPSLLETCQDIGMVSEQEVYDYTNAY
jgi:hypothetical protein